MYAARIAIIVAVALPACYEVPQPDCGFVCGPNGECPSGYTCFGGDLGNVCKRSSPPFSGECEVFIPPDAPDIDPPGLADRFPAQGQEVPPTAMVQVTFDEVVVNVIPELSFILSLNGGIVSSSLTQLGSTTYQLFPLGATLQPGSSYTVELTSDITDVAGHPLEDAPIIWSFTTEPDTTPPMVVFTSPPDGTTNVAVDAMIQIRFTEDVQGVNQSSFRVQQLAVPPITSPLPGQITVASSVAHWQFNPRDQLLPNTDYTITWSSEITDNVFLSVTSGSAMFTTGPDLVRPTIIQSAPMPSAMNIGVAANVTVTFDEIVTNLDDTTFTLSTGATQIPAIVAFDAPNKRATLNPIAQLDPVVQYTVRLANTIADTSGNTLSVNPTAWLFTTGSDFLAPRVLSTLPADDATAVPVDATISVTFDEDVMNVTQATFAVTGAGTGTLAASDGGRTWTFTPDAPMPASAAITVTLSGMEDPSGNALAPVTFDFTTAP